MEKIILQRYISREDITDNQILITLPKFRLFPSMPFFNQVSGYGFRPLDRQAKSPIPAKDLQEHQRPAHRKQNGVKFILDHSIVH